MLIDLGETEERAVKPAAIVEIELVRLIDDGLCVYGGTEAEA